jgi:phage shock protein PspC (stress-responsive transcriptional regulator)
MEPQEHPNHGPQATVPKLYRSTTDRQLGGVCGGIAEYANTDPTVIRVLFIVLAVMGPGLLLYPLLWMFVPSAPGAEQMAAPGPPTEVRSASAA